MDDPREHNTLCLQALLNDATDAPALAAVFAAAYDDLRHRAAGLMTRERADHLLQPTALVNEAYLRLFACERLPVESRTQFLRVASRAMRQVLVDHARGRDCAKRGGGWLRITLTHGDPGQPDHAADVLDLNEALERFADLDPRAALIVEWRIFGGLTMDEIAGQLGITRRTAQKDWRIAILWLRRELARA